MSKQRNRSNIVFADPTVDFVFKKIFGTKEYSSATIDLINSFIEGINVQSVEFLNTVQDKENKNVNEFEKKWLTLLRTSKHMKEVPQELPMSLHSANS